MKKQQITPRTEFDFWRDNEIAKHYTLTLDELKAKFTAWLPTKELAWLNYYRTEMVICAFITEKEGLSSVFEQKQFDQMYDPLKNIYMAHCRERESAKT